MRWTLQQDHRSSRSRITGSPSPTRLVFERAAEPSSNRLHGMALTDAQKTGLEAAILAYLAAEGGRFARTVAAFKEEAQGPGNEDPGNLVVNGAVLEKAWMMVNHTLKSKGKPRTKAFFDAIKSGDLAEVQLYVCVGVDVQAQQYGVEEGLPLYWAAFYNRLEMVELFVRSGHDKEAGGRDGTSPLYIAAQEGHVAVVQYLVEQGADKDKTADEGMTPLYMAAQGWCSTW